jgi:hypothetical protein
MAADHQLCPHPRHKRPKVSAHNRLSRDSHSRLPADFGIQFVELKIGDL